MISIIHKGGQKPVNLFRFECSSCGCVWVTDEVRFVDESNYCLIVSDCPCCKRKDISARGYVG